MKKLLCMIGIHDWKDYEITVCVGSVDKEGNKFPTEQHIIQRCSRCPMVDTSKMRPKTSSL